MMDEEAKTTFKWRILPAHDPAEYILLLVAISVIVFFIIHSPYSVPMIFGMLILALLLSWDFFNRYRKTKKWLERACGYR